MKTKSVTVQDLIDARGERDQLRELCGELLKVLIDADNMLAHCHAGIGYAHRKTNTAIKINAAITKAENALSTELAG